MTSQYATTVDLFTYSFENVDTVSIKTGAKCFNYVTSIISCRSLAGYV